METLRSALAGERSWRRALIAIAVAALVLRLVIAAVTGGGNDLKIYYAFASLVTDGANPYHPPAGFPIPARLSDNLPGEFLLFAGLLEIDHSKYVLRVLFALADMGVILLVGLKYPRPIAWRAAFTGFYAFNPLVLGSWTATAEDKTVLFLLFAAMLLALETGRYVGSWAAATVMGVLKGVSIFFAPFLAWETWRRRGLGVAAACTGGFAVLLFLGHLPWFPDAFEVYNRRNGHIEFRDPGHAAITQFLDRAGLYDPAIVRYGVPLLLVATFAAYVFRRVDVIEGIVLANLATLILQPDHAYTRALLAALPFLFVIRLSAHRWAALWVVSTLASIGIYLQQERGQLGGYGSLAHVVVANAFLVLVVAYYVRDKIAGRAGSLEAPSLVSPG
ncbi:MAG: hypothetical protein QOJ12_294 [Thermoleophilales bacterium]|nr:hypothetical protein [Thermoleophilales bacterium]